jgi:hypothetical protein
MWPDACVEVVRRANRSADEEQQYKDCSARRIARLAHTDDLGAYRFEDVVPGAYSMAITWDLRERPKTSGLIALQWAGSFLATYAEARDAPRYFVLASLATIDFDGTEDMVFDCPFKEQ